MKQIGICSTWGIPNYGSFWQMYCLRALAEELTGGVDARAIAYQHRTHLDAYYSVFCTGMSRHWPVSRYFWRLALSRLFHYRKLQEKRKFLRYFWDELPHTEAFTGETVRRASFDTVILGSDIIWDYTQPIFGHDPLSFGVGFQSRKTLSYAASFGTVKPGMTSPAYVKEGLAKLSAISVRDENSARLVREYSGREAEVVLDPTLAYDFSKIPGIPRPAEDGKYIVVYGSNFAKPLVEGAVVYAKKHGLRLLCLDSGGDDHPWCDKIIRQHELDPFGWAGYFRHAEAVMTCTYHGLMFGLLSKKPIIFQPTPFILDKASSLMDALGLTEVLAGDVGFDEKVGYDWDYGRIDGLLAPMRERSLTFLKKALTDEC